MNLEILEPIAAAINKEDKDFQKALAAFRETAKIIQDTLKSLNQEDQFNIRVQNADDHSAVRILITELNENGQSLGTLFAIAATTKENEAPTITFSTDHEDKIEHYQKTVPTIVFGDVYLHAAHSALLLMSDELGLG